MSVWCGDASRVVTLSKFNEDGLTGLNVPDTATFEHVHTHIHTHASACAGIVWKDFDVRRNLRFLNHP